MTAMSIDLGTIFFEDYNGVKWEIGSQGLRNLSWSTEEDLLEIPWPIGDSKIVEGSLDNHLDIIRKAFAIWDQSIPSIQFTETSIGNEADITLAITDVDGVGGREAQFASRWDSDNFIENSTIEFDTSDFDQLLVGGRPESWACLRHHESLLDGVLCAGDRPAASPARGRCNRRPR